MQPTKKSIAEQSMRLGRTIADRAPSGRRLTYHQAIIPIKTPSTQPIVVSCDHIIRVRSPESISLARPAY